VTFCWELLLASALRDLWRGKFRRDRDLELAVVEGELPPGETDDGGGERMRACLYATR
jgi:hypothetical protein